MILISESRPRVIKSGVHLGNAGLNKGGFLGHRNRQGVEMRQKSGKLKEPADQGQRHPEGHNAQLIAIKSTDDALNKLTVSKKIKAQIPPVYQS